jgi:hypothetical protein
MEIPAQYVIDNLLEQNAQLTLQIAMLQAALKEASSEEGEQQTGGEAPTDR